MMLEEWRQIRQGARQRLAVALVISVALVAVEVTGGLFANSLALLSDAVHVLTDVCSLTLALVALWFADRPISAQRTFGAFRIESIAALTNGLLLLVMALWVAAEAFGRLQAPTEVRSVPMLAVAVAGLLANVVAGLALLGASRDNL